MTRGGGFKKRPTRIVRKRIVIATEGTVTEAQYFEGLLQELRSAGSAVSTVKVHTVGRDPQKVVKAALDKNQADGDGFDELWAVVDVDDHARLEDALLYGKRYGVSVVVSNPCFELWLLWHHQAQRGHQTKGQIESQLKKHGHASGEKTLPVSFPFDKYVDAMDRAKENECAVGASNANPSSSMCHLLESILSSEPLN